MSFSLLFHLFDGMFIRARWWFRQLYVSNYLITTSAAIPITFHVLSLLCMCMA
jgi:hypothetical protein